MTIMLYTKCARTGSFMWWCAYSGDDAPTQCATIALERYARTLLPNEHIRIVLTPICQEA